MKITIENTNKIVMLKPDPLLDGIPARIWEGTTESGIKVILFVTRIMAPAEADLSQFNAQLEKCSAPSAEAEAIPLRLIL